MQSAYIYIYIYKYVMTRYRSLKGRQRISDIILINEGKWGKHVET